MDKEIDKQLDRLTDKLLKDLPRESPSIDFTTKVMANLEVVPKIIQTSYRPVISKRSWLFLAGLFVGLFAYLIYGDVKMANSWTTVLPIDSFPKLGSLIDFSGFKISKVIVYGVTGFTFFIGIQIFMLKNHFNKRYA